MKYLILKNETVLKKVINYLIHEENLPKIQRRLNIFAADDTLQIEIVNNQVSYREKNRVKSV